ncbi:MAG: type II secretion system F family protein [Thermomicrobiales bacterium]
MILGMGLIVAVLGAVMVVYGMKGKRATVNIDERLASFAERPQTLQELEMSQSFGNRVLKPLFKRWSLTLGKRTPTKTIEANRLKIMRAGNPSGIGPVEFQGLRFLIAILLGAGSFFLLSLPGALSGILLIMPIVLGVFGFLLPGIWLDRKIKARKKEILRALPDAIDLLTISVESGLGFDPALMRVAEKWDNALTREFARLLSEMRIGKPRREALKEMSERVDEDDLTVFVASIIQADQLGVPITQVLRVQSDAMRVRRRQRAEERAQKAPIKMLIPIAFLIFPSLFVVILGPTVPKIVEAFGK